VIKAKMATGDVGQIRNNVTRSDLNQTVLHIFGMHEHNVVQHLKFTQQSSTYEAVEVAASNEAIIESLQGHRNHTARESLRSTAQVTGKPGAGTRTLVRDFVACCICDSNLAFQDRLGDLSFSVVVILQGINHRFLGDGQNVHPGADSPHFFCGLLRI
jgi:hypothetical protein